MIYHKNTWEGVDYSLTIHEWVTLTGFTHETLNYRIKQFNRGKMTREEVMFVGVLNCNRGRPPKNIPFLNRVLPDHLSIFLYQSERPETTRIKAYWEMMRIRKWLGSSAYMNQVRG